jgi:SET domain-containing protein
VDGDDPPASVWAHPDVTVGPSPIEGRGLFAAADVPPGTLVLRLGGRVVGSADLVHRIAAADAGWTPYVDTITVGDDRHLVLPAGSAAHFANHSCDPTLWHDGPYRLVARRAVAAGEELTVDYGTDSGAAGFAMACACGSAACRGRVTGDDWRRPELRARYAGHFAFGAGVRPPSGPGGAGR